MTQKKCIGIIGGLTPESTKYYYEIITKKYAELSGDFDYPRIIIYSVSLQDYIDWGNSQNLKAIEDDLVLAVDALQRAGADFAIISANTPHQVYDQVVARVQIPVISIVEAVREAASEQGLKKLGLIGTKITMTQDFYPVTMSKAGIEIIVPEANEQKIIHEIIFKELSRGIVDQESKRKYIEIINALVKRGSGGVVLGCTEIPLLIKQNDVDIPILDSSLIHAEAALKFALG